MKNSSKKNYSRNNSKAYKKDSDYDLKNKNSSKKNNRFLTNTSKDKKFNIPREGEKNKSNYSSLNRKKPTTKTNFNVSNNANDISI